MVFDRKKSQREGPCSLFCVWQDYCFLKNMGRPKEVNKAGFAGKVRKPQKISREEIGFPLSQIIVKNDEVNMKKQNCWEFKKCGREPGGEKTSELGVCPAASDESCSGLNAGTAGGRICWAVTGTFCGGKVQGTSAQKQLTCMSCEFFVKVKDEEGPFSFLMLKPGQVFKKHE